MPEDVTAGARIQTADALEEAARKLRSADLSMTNEEIGNILHRAQDQIDHFREEIGARYHEAEEEYHRKVEPVENVIHDHPIPSVLVALGIGFLFGMLIGRHHD